MEVLIFDLKIAGCAQYYYPCGPGPFFAGGVESASFSGISAARQCSQMRQPQKKHGESPINEDNGFAAANFMNASIGQQAASQLLATAVMNVRNSSSNSAERAGKATMASAVLTMDGIAMHCAGDAIIAAVSSDRVVVLNELHNKHNELECVTNFISPGSLNIDAKRKADFVAFRPWQAIEALMGADYKILVCSDGMSESHAPKAIADDILALIKERQLNIHHSAFAASLLRASVWSKEGKTDDRIVITTAKPNQPAEQSIIAAIDGVSSGGKKSAEVAKIIADELAFATCMFAGQPDIKQIPVQTQEFINDEIDRWWQPNPRLRREPADPKPPANPQFNRWTPTGLTPR